jgi:YegS/Rv2252/BmrU family lipid kinase
MAELKTFLVVNPMSAAGRTGKRFPEIAAAVRGGIGEFGHAFTTKGGEATELARKALRDGYERVVAVGGDGTINEVVNGFFEGGKAINPQGVLAVIPRGTGGDFRKTFGWSNELADAVKRLAGPDLAPLDVGELRFVDGQGRDAVRHFVNVASCGISGDVDDQVNKSSFKGLGGGKLSFKLASLKALLGYANKPVKVRFDDGAEERLDQLTCLAVGNGQYFGGGMWVCPKAQPDDGYFDVTIWERFGLSDFMFKQGAIYNGEHLKMDGVRTTRARKVSATSDAEVLLDVDGEQPGRLPATWQVLPAAIRVNR